MVMGWAGLLWFIDSWVRALGGGGLGWTGLWVRGFVGRSRVRVGELSCVRLVLDASAQ